MCFSFIRVRLIPHPEVFLIQKYGALESSAEARKGVIMNNVRRARLAGLVCLAGGMLQLIYGLLAIPFPYAENNFGWAEVLWALANVGMIGGVLGLLALDVARPRWLAVIGAALSILGNLNRIVVSALLILRPSPAYVPLILITILLLILGMGTLGITTLLGKQLSSWQAWTPLLAVAFSLIPVAVYSISQYAHFILLGLWGLPWMLVGYVVFTHAAKQEQAMLGQASSAAAKQVPGLTHSH
jgi:hypothetical protein